MQVENLIPVLDVRDVDISVEFYCDVLGFTLQDKVEWGGRTEWALLRTGKAQLMLCASQDHSDDDEQRLSEGLFFLHLDNPDAFIVRMGKRALKQGAREQGIEPEAKLGSKDFYLRDPDGYILWFSHRPPVQTQIVDERQVEVGEGSQDTENAPPEKGGEGGDAHHSSAAGVNSATPAARHRSGRAHSSFSAAHNGNRHAAS